MINYPTVLREAVDESKVPGAVLCVGDLASIHFLGSYGDRQLIPNRRAAEIDTLYDLASLTKVVCTATAIMQLKERGQLSIEQSITDFVPLRSLEQVTLKDLLTHTAGIVPVERYFESMHSLEEILQDCSQNGIEHPVDYHHNYSDLGFMLLGKVLELVSGMGLDQYCRENIFQPLDMQRTAFNPSKSWKENCAPTEDDSWRGRLIHGEVHDENCSVIGGVSGHAGLFSTASDLANFCRGLLSGKLMKSETFAEMVAFGTKPLYPWQGLGWQVDPWATKKTGFLPSRRAFGHTGWTGTSLWLDAETGLFSIVLSNSCHPDRLDRDSETLRRVVHTAVGKEFYTTTNSHSGLDRLIRENFVRIRGKRIAVLTNHAAIDQSGRHILDVLPDCPDLKLERLYSPEHGIRGQAEAGEKVEGQESAVPVTSLYGKQKAPTREELKGIQLFVVDLQDIGARYYTYMATMLRCVEACAKAKVPVLVLDRPNPLGGNVLEGPIAQETESLVSCSAIPIRHGMTMGELATWFAQNDLKKLRPKVTVNYLDSWQPYRWFPECNLPWRAPSPNMPSPETALLYIGTCLIEGTNMNEGRGTDTPFLIFGAPWLDAEAVLAELGDEDAPGLSLATETYTPRSIPGKSTNPKFLDTECRGIRLTITDAYAVRAFYTTVALLIAIRKHHSEDLEFVDMFSILAGGPDLLSRIQSGESVASITEAYATEVAEFESKRPRLYDPDGVPFEHIRNKAAENARIRSRK